MTQKISDRVKIFRLMPIFLGIAFVWSISTAISTDAFQSMSEFGNDHFRKIFVFFGFYLGNGIPRFLIYAFCFCYMIYQSYPIVGKFNIEFKHGIIISIIIGGLSAVMKDSTFCWIAYILCLSFELYLYNIYLTKTKFEDS